MAPNMCILVLVLLLAFTVDALAWLENKNRRDALEALVKSIGSGSISWQVAPSHSVADATEASQPTYSKSGLAARLAQRDPSVLKNKVFNVPPGAQIYPEWLRGNWAVTSSFNGFIFPSSKIPKERLVKDYNVGGFQKCSIAATADVGKENVHFVWSVDERTGFENRSSNLQQSIDAYLGYKSVKQVLYDVKSNPNRISIDFVDYKTVNAERIELFCNARESESYLSTTGTPVFVCSEYARQVTFGTGSTPGVPRQISTNYANFWTWQQTGQDSFLKGNLLTACFLDPQDPLYFDEPTLPVAIYSHVFTGKKIA